MSDLNHQPASDSVLVLPIAGTPDLVHLPREVHHLLTGVNERVVADAVLVAVMLAGDAFRYGQPPVTLRLQLVPSRQCLRLEVKDHRPLSANVLPHGYRARLLDRLAQRRGLERSGDGDTQAWAEISLFSNAVPPRRATACQPFYAAAR